jgi:hypothetical protein
MGIMSSLLLAHPRQARQAMSLPLHEIFCGDLLVQQVMCLASTGCVDDRNGEAQQAAWLHMPPVPLPSMPRDETHTTSSLV